MSEQLAQSCYSKHKAGSRMRDRRVASPAPSLTVTPADQAFSSILDKYQLSLIDPRDGIVLQTELDDYCDKLVVERRSRGVYRRRSSLSSSERPPFSS